MHQPSHVVGPGKTMPALERLDPRARKRVKANLRKFFNYTQQRRLQRELAELEALTALEEEELL